MSEWVQTATLTYIQPSIQQSPANRFTEPVVELSYLKFYNAYAKASRYLLFRRFSKANGHGHRVNKVGM